jgi:signal transduction histidine kinase
VVTSFEPQAQRKDQALQWTVSDAPCVVAGDRGKLREAMINLLSNALKYAPPGTSVGVTVTQDNGTVKFSVSDEGPGLSSRDQERLFAPFQRLTPKPTGDEGTSGLGLYIVKQIVSLHDGDVKVDTVLGEGSTFTLVLPRLHADVRSEKRNEAAGTEVETE